MKNFTEASVTSEEVFNSAYETSLAWARTQQAKENKKESTNVSYTIEQEGNKGIVKKHTGWLGGQPPYQELVHHSAN